MILHTVNVGSTTSVVAGEDGLELDNALVVTGLDTAKESCIQIGSIGRVAVTTGLDSRVDTLLQKSVLESYCSFKAPIAQVLS